MKASEFIAALQNAVAQYGDLDIVIRGQDGHEWEGGALIFEPSPPEK